MQKLVQTRTLLVTFWVGSIWTLGYVVAPVLFATLTDRMLAGAIAGQLFRVEAWISLICGSVILAWSILFARKATGMGKIPLWWFILGMLLCAMISLLVLQPMMAALKSNIGGVDVLTSQNRTQFATLHMISSGLYLLQSALGVVLVLRHRQAP